MDAYRRTLLAAMARITEVAATEVDTNSSVVIDVREPHELGVGMLPGAIAVGMAQLSDEIGAIVPDPDSSIVLYCAVGERSAIAAAMLADRGYSNVTSLAGGINHWMASNLPTTASSTLTEAQRRRYARHIVLPNVGAQGQQKLLSAKMVIVGAGGLGSPAALYLTAAGVGTLGLIDHDVVELSNLQRQLLHDTADVARPKTESGADRLRAMNPDVRVVTHSVRLGAANALEILAGYDVIIDGTDSFTTRYLINDASLHLRTPVVHGSVFRFEGQVSVFSPDIGPCYRCLFPTPPPSDLAPNCTQAGVFGVLPGVIGTMQATEAIKLVLGLGTPLIGRLLTYDGLDQSTHTVSVPQNPECLSCGDKENPPALRDETEYC